MKTSEYNKKMKKEFSKFKPFFDKYEAKDRPVNYKYDVYNDTISVTFYGTLDFDTITDLFAKGYQFDIRPWGDNWLRVIIH